MGAFLCQCGGKTGVLSSRKTALQDKMAIRRRRKCVNCSKLITTYELEASVAETIGGDPRYDRLRSDIAGLIGVSI